MRVALLALALTLGAPAAAEPPAPAEPPAFPGAVGYGRVATGWRGGAVVAVTTLADAGPGSLRACAGRAGRREGERRVCVFRVGGTIAVDSTILVASRTYIAGQTAPGGVQVRLREGQAAPLAVRGARDVLIRHLALRPGASTRPSANVDAITIEDAARVYLDHLSLAFATDENLNLHADRREVRDITVARSIVALGLDRANHPKGGHSKGALICSGKPARPGRRGARCGRITLFANLFAHNRDRNPDVKASATGPVEVIGNVFYNPKSQFGEFYGLLGPTRIAYRGNLALAGPSTRSRPRPAAVEAFPGDAGEPFAIHAHDNRAAIPAACRSRRSGRVIDPAAVPFVVTGPWQGSGTQAPPARDLPGAVLARAGARAAATPSGLDALDAQIVRDVLNCSGRVIDAAAEAGGWPRLGGEVAPPDTDGDGMADDWERAEGLDPRDPLDAWTVRPGERFAPVERYLQHLAERRTGLP